MNPSSFTCKPAPSFYSQHTAFFEIPEELINEELVSSDYDQISRIIEHKLDHFSARNTTTAFHQLAAKFSHDWFIDDLVKKALAQTQDFSPQEIADMAWALAKLRFCHKELLLALAQEAIKKNADLAPQDIAHTVWAFATLGIKNEKLFSVLSHAAIEKMAGFNSQNIANCAWAFAILGIRNTHLFDLLAKQTIDQIESFMPIDIAALTWSFAIIDYFNKGYFEKINAHITKIAEQFNTQESLHQIRHVQLYLDLEQHFPFAKCLDKKIKRSFHALKSQKPPSSQLHQDISRHITKNFTQLRFENEFFIEGFFLDIAFPDSKTGIEVQGPSHFHNGQLNCQTQFKIKLLKKLGWDIQCISYKDWYGKNNQERTHYLKNVFQEKEGDH
jgi:hypothetical protein